MRHFRITAASGCVPGVDANVPDEDWLRGVREHYSGNVILGKGLLDVSL